MACTGSKTSCKIAIFRSWVDPDATAAVGPPEIGGDVGRGAKEELEEDEEEEEDDEEEEESPLNVEDEMEGEAAREL